MVLLGGEAMNTTPIYACFHDKETLPVGYLKTPEEVTAWAAQVTSNGHSVRIVPLYELQRPEELWFHPKAKVPCSSS
jgi:uncharacterized protein YabN with tetrapyrrole methylase and pyrophosphatase domain